MSHLDKLIAYFEQFPGTGARQARRFAFHILTMSRTDTEELAQLITNLKQSVAQCQSCFRFFTTPRSDQSQCDICRSTDRDHSQLLIVERDPDVQSIERSGTYRGRYFVLGGTAPLLNIDDTKKLRGGTLKRIVEERANTLSEIILGFSVNPDGENTARFVESILIDIAKEHHINISRLGRGLSTGSELEYADPETIKNALENRA